MLAGQDSERESFGAQLRRLRERAGLSQEALAERAGLGVNTLAARELGRRRRPHPHTLDVLASALGLAPAERARLLDLTGVPGAQQPSPATAAAAPPEAARPVVSLPSPLTPLIRLLGAAEVKRRASGAPPAPGGAIRVRVRSRARAR